MSQLNTNSEGLQALLEIANALPDAIEIDTTLSQAGMAADAKAVGDAIANLQDNTVDTTLSSTSTNPVQNKIITEALSSKSDIGHTQDASTITGGSFAGAVIAQTSTQAPATSLLRNSKLVTTETNPSNNGEINWKYE